MPSVHEAASAYAAALPAPVELAAPPLAAVSPIKQTTALTVPGPLERTFNHATLDTRIGVKAGASPTIGVVS